MILLNVGNNLSDYLPILFMFVVAV
ncbi:MAG: hypothetical protein RLZZ318_1197, partial [Bacteroidota bacterium]